MAKKKEYTCVLVETDGEGITWITFNRPEKRNAMNPTLHVEMEEILFGLETDEDTKVIVLTGAGNSWSAGMDSSSIFARRIKTRWRVSGRRRRTVAGPRSCSLGRASQPSPWSMAIVTAAHSSLSRHAIS